MILIAAPYDDAHALAVARAIYELKEGAAVALLHGSDFPLRARIKFGLEGWAIEEVDGSRRIASDDITAIWWRRPGGPRLSDELVDATARRFAHNECVSAFTSIAVWPGYRVINQIERENIADKKAFQLKIASSCGLKVPRTLITNDRKALEQFRQEVGAPLVFKVLTSPISSFAETRRLLDKHSDDLKSLIHAPVIFQQELDRHEDIRVTVVGDELFAATVVNQSESGRLYPDWRLDPAAECQLCELPLDVSQSIKALATQLGLEYCAIDLIKTSSGDYYFLEVNPSGQFLFVEIDTGQKISEAMARLLLK